MLLKSFILKSVMWMEWVQVNLIALKTFSSWNLYSANELLMQQNWNAFLYRFWNSSYKKKKSKFSIIVWTIYSGEKVKWLLMKFYFWLYLFECESFTFNLPTIVEVISTIVAAKNKTETIFGENDFSLERKWFFSCDNVYSDCHTKV